MIFIQAVLFFLSSICHISIWICLMKRCVVKMENCYVYMCISHEICVIMTYMHDLQYVILLFRTA